MSEEIIIDKKLSRQERYASLIPQIKGLVMDENDLVANLANIMSALKFSMDFFWVGVYIVKNNELVLGPFQGPVACTRIQMGRGVCGKCWEDAKTIIVPDVEQFPGHIACSSLSKSEIVVPVMQNGKVSMVIDVDSDELNSFDETDRKYLEEISVIIAGLPS